MILNFSSVLLTISLLNESFSFQVAIVLSKKYIDYMKNNYNGDIIMGSVFINDEPDSENINILMGMSRAFGIMTHGAIVSNVITYNDIITNKLLCVYSIDK